MKMISLLKSIFRRKPRAKQFPEYFCGRHARIHFNPCPDCWLEACMARERKAALKEMERMYQETLYEIERERP